MDVDTESMRKAKVEIGGSTQETDAALTAFVAELESFGECWGNDDLGSLIGLSYQGIYAVAMDCFAHNLDTIDRQVPAWLETSDGGATVTVRDLPLREQIDVPVREQLIVELYSK